MRSWRETTWGDEISLEYGKGIRDYADATGPYRVFGSNGPVGWTSQALAPGPGVILGRKGAYRGVRYSADPFFVIDTAYYVRPKTELDMRWLYYAIVYHKLGEIDDGSPIPSTTRSAVYVRELQVPPPNEQCAIAEILGALDDRIDLNRHMNETLEALGRAIFKEWFVDFGPVRAKAAGRLPALTSEIEASFPSALDDEDKPVGWVHCKVKDLCEKVENGGTPARSEPSYWEGGTVPWLTSGEVREPIVCLTENFITPAGLAASSAKVWPKGTTVVAMYGATAGEVCLLAEDMCTNQACCGLIPRKKARELLFLTMRASRADLASRARGSAQQNLSQGLIAEFDVLRPDEETLSNFHGIVSPLLDRSILNTKQSVALAAMREFLLPKLMSGEIRLKEAEQAVEAVL